MAIIRVDPQKVVSNGGKGRVSRQTKYGARKGSKPAGTINTLKGNRRG
jgi:hypothetical protein